MQTSPVKFNIEFCIDQSITVQFVHGHLFVGPYVKEIFIKFLVFPGGPYRGPGAPNLRTPPGAPGEKKLGPFTWGPKKRWP